MSDHAVLAPSFAPVWGKCSGAVPASANYPSFSSEQSERGTAAHWVCSEVLSRFARPDGGAPSTYDYLGKKAPNGMTIDEDMAEGAAEFVADVLKVAQEHGALGDIVVEERVHMPAIHAENWGTLDARIWIPSKGLLYVWDYKHGHRAVSAFENLQMIDYTNGLVEKLRIDGHAEQHVSVRLRIVQPFAYKPGGPVDEWRVTAAEFRGYYNQLATKAHEAVTAPKLSPGKHCRDCPALQDCRAATQASMTWADYADSPYALDAKSPRDLGAEYAILSEAVTLLKARRDAIEETLKNDPAGSGYTIETKLGRLSWGVDEAVAATVCKQLGVDIAKPATVTPTQALAKAKSNEAATIAIKQITARPSRGVALIKAADSKVSKAFQRKT